MRKTGLPRGKSPRFITDNGSCYISGELKEFIREKYGPHSGETELPPDPGKDRRLPSFHLEHLQIEQVLPAGRIEGKVAGVSEVLQLGKISRVLEVPHRCLCIHLQGRKNIKKTKIDKRKNDAKKKKTASILNVETKI